MPVVLKLMSGLRKLLPCLSRCYGTNKTYIRNMTSHSADVEAGGGGSTAPHPNNLDGGIDPQ